MQMDRHFHGSFQAAHQLIGIERGQQTGTVRVELDGKVIAERPLVALEAVEEAGFFKRLWHEFLMWWNA